MSAMTHPIRRLTQVFATTLLFLSTGVTAALAQPAPIETELPSSGGQTGSTGGPESASGFPWLLTGSAVLLAIALVTLVAVMWHRAHAVPRRLATP
jgi:hypothetical protein